MVILTVSKPFIGEDYFLGYKMISRPIAYLVKFNPGEQIPLDAHAYKYIIG